MSNHYSFQLLIVGLLLLGCQSKKQDFTETTDSNRNAQMFYDSIISVNELNVPIDDNQFYFPLAQFPVKEYYYAGDSSDVQQFKTKIIVGEQDTSLVKEYSVYLYAMNEPLLFNKPMDKEVYRFTWLRSFHNPIAIRIEKRGNKYIMVWKRCDGAGGYGPGELVVNKTKKISPGTWKAFKSRLFNSNFWDKSLGRASFGTDGSEWIVEAATPERYRVITGWSPRQSAFREACIYLLRLTDLEVPEDELY